MLLGELLFFWLQGNWQPLGRLQDFIGDFTRALPRSGSTAVFVVVVRVVLLGVRRSRIAVFAVALFRVAVLRAAVFGVAVLVLIIGGFGVAVLRAAFFYVFLVRQKPDLNGGGNIGRLGVGAGGDHHQLSDIAILAARSR